MENEKDITLRAALSQTARFFDMFHYPLTALEYHSYVKVKCTINDVISNVETTNINTRTERYNYSRKKEQKLKKYLKLFKLCPYIKMICMSNLIGFHNLRKESDIDLLVISKRNRVWLTRLYLAGLGKILNLRPNSKTKQDKFCFSFYVDEDSLNLERFKLDNDPYFEYWMLGLRPMYSKDNMEEKFWLENNWVREIFPNWQPTISETKIKKNKNNKLGDKLEKLAEKIQMRIMPKEIKDQINQNKGVVVGPGVLKFYLKDKRAEIALALENKS